MGIRPAIITAALALAFPGVAQAHRHPQHRVAAPVSCPAGVPVQAITVVNQAKARPFALAKVENAVVAQSIQLRAAWGTPCVQFGRGGWPLYLRIGGGASGLHLAAPTRVYVLTGGVVYRWWSQAFSHEVLEALANPGGVGYYVNAEGNQLEVADPVDERAYKLEGVWVSDFALPAWYAGATTGTAIWCQATCVDSSPLIAPADAPGPYDEMGILTGPWQAQWERAG